MRLDSVVSDGIRLDVWHEYRKGSQETRIDFLLKITNLLNRVLSIFPSTPII